MTRLEHVRALRGNTDVHYNCCQSVLVPFAKEMGLSEEQAYALGAIFGSGMRHGAVCGVISGAMMVLGAAGYDDKTATAFLRQFKEAHGATDCASLLKSSHDRGEEKKVHCDGLVYEAVTALDALFSD